MKKPTTVRLPDELRQRIEAVATERGVSVTAIVEAACASYLDTERILDELQATEDRIAASLAKTHREAARAGDDVQLAIALLDSLIRFVTMSTPEVVDKTTAGIVGARRYTGLLDELKGSITTRGRATILERLAEGQADRVKDDQHE
ncbi:CopG family ribbon-helix-helix protein [Cupriavidus basilensis]